MVSFISAFLKRLSTGDSVESIKRDLNRRPPSNAFVGTAFSATVSKCPNLESEYPCYFDLSGSASAAATRISGSPRSADTTACSCCHHDPSPGEANTGEMTACMEGPEAERPATFESFSCALTTPKTCLNGICSYASRPIYRREARHHDTITSPVAGGGDAFVERNRRRTTGCEDSDTSAFDDYSEVAILDSGANRHAFGNTRFVTRRRPANLRTTTADGSQVRISEEGDVIIPSVDAKGQRIDPLILRDVSVMRGSPINLVSVGMLCNEGSSFHFSKDDSYFIHEGRKVRLIERNGLYFIRLNDVLEKSEVDRLVQCEVDLGNPCPTEMKSKAGSTYACAATWELWHERFGHASKKRLKFLFDNGSAEGMAVRGKYTHDRKCTCPTCLSVNNAKVHIGDVRKFGDAVTQRGELIYTDVCGPFPASVEGYRYVVSFTDTYSRFSACYFLKKKSEVEEALKALIKFYAQQGAIIREIRSDQGGEFGGHNETFSHHGEGGTLRDNDSLDFHFKRVCEQHNIKHVLMPAHRPELHGIAERWNKTVMQMANSMLFASRLSHVLWPSAVAHANLLRNRLPLTGLGPYTPYELFFHKRPRIDNLRVFGCDAYKLLPIYPKIPGQAARKRLIYVGESADRVGFRCFDPVTYKFSTEFELIFDEASAKKRINSLYEYDARRDLKRQGNLHKLPLQTDDYSSDSPPQQAVRDIFSRDLESPPSALPRSGEGRDNTGLKGATFEHQGQGDGRSRYSAADRQPGEHSSKPDELDQPTHRKNDDTDSGSDTRTDASSKPESTNSSCYHPGAANGMGRMATSQEPPRESTREAASTRTTTEEEDDESEPEEEFKIHGQTIRPGRLPTLRPRKHQHDLNLNEIEGASTLLNDDEATEFGPLTEAALEQERKRSQLDPSFPRRPLRLLPVGQVEKDTPESKAFRRFALENDAQINLLPNPKQAGKLS